MALAVAPQIAEFSEFGLVATPTLGAFQLLDRLDCGGMATVFKAQDVRTGELVAVKTVRTDSAHPEREVACLEHEIAILKSLRHPGVVRFVGAGTWNERPWMAVELLDGRTMFEEISTLWRRAATEELAEDFAVQSSGGWMQRLQHEPELSWPRRPAAGGRLRDATSIIVRLARVLSYVHGQGIVHRDLKPENVFLGHDGRLTLLDFGLATRLRGRGPDGEGAVTTVATTVEYAAPEVLRGERIDARADVYALGCMFYELVTGARPFEGSVDAIVRMHLDQQPTCPSDLVTGISWRLEDLILDMMAKRPRQRPRDGAEVAARLADAFLDEAMDGPPRAAA